MNTTTPQFFKTKASALKAAAGTSKLLCNSEITKYFLLNDHNEFCETISKEAIKCFYECIRPNTPVPPFFDIEIYNGSPHFPNQGADILQHIYDTIASKFPGFTLSKRIALQAHSDEKISFHLVLQLRNIEGKLVLFKNVAAIKDFYKMCKFDSFKNEAGSLIIDSSVYREGLFRTIYSSKSNENRPLLPDSSSDQFEDVEAFVTWYPTLSDFVLYEPEQTTRHRSPRSARASRTEEHAEDTVVEEVIDLDLLPVNTPVELNNDDMEVVKKFIHKEFHHFPNSVREIIVDRQFNCIVVALTQKYCPFKEREHRSNHQYIIIDTSSAKQKCHDTDCTDQKYNEIKLEKYPVNLNVVVKKCLQVNRREMDLIEKAVEDSRQYIIDNFNDNVEDLSFDRSQMMFRGIAQNMELLRLTGGTCPQCNVEHQISDAGHCLRCTVCNAMFPKEQLIPVNSRYNNLTTFWSKYTQLVNNGTINNNIVNNYYGSAEDIEFSCDVHLDASIFNNRDLTTLFNQILDGHKIAKISEVLSKYETEFVYTGDWYLFNGSIWKSDKESLDLKKRIINMSINFEKIKRYYEAHTSDPTNHTIVKNVKSLITKLNKPSFQDDIIKAAKMYYVNEEFLKKLNSKKHLVPFTNGVFDLVANCFRPTTREDYVNLTTSFTFDASVYNSEVWTFLEQILPNPRVRDFVLKKMSDCLNGDIPNTHFSMFVGDGANGKSQLLNLMKITIGELGEKVEVTLLTRKRNNANEANTEKIKLMNKRFAFLSEPEDGEKINIGLLKELTGSEEIVARGLYQASVSFVMEAKLFLACNELPEIKGEDTALWRRIRVVDFPSRFVDEPKEENEYAIDRTLPTRIREDVTWRQTFMNILLEYYYKTVTEPQEVSVSTTQYRDDNNDFVAWLGNNIKYKENEILRLSDVLQSFFGKSIASKKQSKCKTSITKWLSSKFPTLDTTYKDTSFRGSNFKGWVHFTIESSE